MGCTYLRILNRNSDIVFPYNNKDVESPLWEMKYKGLRDKGIKLESIWKENIWQNME